MSTPVLDLGWLAFAAAAAAGTSSALAAALMADALSRLPPENRQYSDFPPLAFRVTWLPIRALSQWITPVLPQRVRAHVKTMLLHAGLDFALTEEQFVGFQLIAALISALLTAFVTSTWMTSWPAASVVLGSAIAAGAGAILPWIWARDVIRARQRAVHKTLPFVLDLITLCIEAGLTLQSAFAHSVAKGPDGPLRDEMARVLRDHRAGKNRVDALRHMASRMHDTAIVNLTSALIQAETLGMNLGPILRAQAEQRRDERFARAEKLAMEAPVKMLFPLVVFIFPCTFIVLGFPIAIKFMRAGI